MKDIKHSKQLGRRRRRRSGRPFTEY